MIPPFFSKGLLLLPFFHLSFLEKTTFLGILPAQGRKSHESMNFMTFCRLSHSHYNCFAGKTQQKPLKNEFFFSENFIFNGFSFTAVTIHPAERSHAAFIKEMLHSWDQRVCGNVLQMP